MGGMNPSHREVTRKRKKGIKREKRGDMKRDEIKRKERERAQRKKTEDGDGREDFSILVIFPHAKKTSKKADRPAFELKYNSK